MAQVLEVSQVGRIAKSAAGRLPVCLHSNDNAERGESSLVRGIEKSAGQVQQVETDKLCIVQPICLQFQYTVDFNRIVQSSDHQRALNSSFAKIKRVSQCVPL